MTPFSSTFSTFAPVIIWTPSDFSRLAAAVAIAGLEWYYEVLRLRPALSQLGVGHCIEGYLTDGPAPGLPGRVSKPFAESGESG